MTSEIEVNVKVNVRERTRTLCHHLNKENKLDLLPIASEKHPNIKTEE